MIFGYGDEDCEEYKTIEKKNDDRYHKNMKSNNYAESSKYANFYRRRRLWVYVIGHSCSLCNKTALNKLFGNETLLQDTNLATKYNLLYNSN